MRAARLWPLGIVAVLALTVGANVILFRAANDRNAAAVEPDYYRKGVRWDSTVAEERASAALGWHAEAGLGPPSRAGTPLTVRLVGPGGAPLEGAAVEVTAIHNLDALHHVSARLEPLGGGVYGARLPLRHAGMWELRIEAVRGAARFRTTLRRDTAQGPRPGGGPGGGPAGTLAPPSRLRSLFLAGLRQSLAPPGCGRPRVTSSWPAAGPLS